jgi:DNA polymerase-1
MTTPRFKTLLYDGDTIAFIAAAAVQMNVVDDQGFTTQWANEREGQVVVDNLIAGSARTVESEEATRVFFLSDKANWRKDVWSGYKANRKDVARPLLLDTLKDYLRDAYQATSVPRLEADDLIGIAMTLRPMGECVSIGRDKDFMTIPGFHCRIQTDTVQHQTREGAIDFHAAQTLAGDRVDGFAGAPGIGMTRALRIIAEDVKVVPERGIITRGKNKGKEVTKWMSTTCHNKWECIVSHYEKGGLTEREALLNARLANILWADQYNAGTGEIELWYPSRLLLPPA